MQLWPLLMIAPKKYAIAAKDVITYIIITVYPLRVAIALKDWRNPKDASKFINLYFSMYRMRSNLGKPLFEMCCFHMGIACKGAGV